MSFEVSSNFEDVSSRREKIEAEIAAFRKRIAEKFSGEGLKKVEESLEFMLKIHLPQKDRADGRPFASHPLAVAEKVIAASDNPDLAAAALIHDGVEDQSDRIFVERIERKYPGRDFMHLEINAETKEKYKDVFKEWSFREIRDRFGDKVRYYTENMTNHDYNSLAESLGLSGEAKQDFVNEMYAEHVEAIIDDPELFTLKLADLSVNIDLHSLDPNSEKYRKLKRKYKSVIEAVRERLAKVGEGHPLYANKDRDIAELDRAYSEFYS